MAQIYPVNTGRPDGAIGSKAKIATAPERSGSPTGKHIRHLLSDDEVGGVVVTETPSGDTQLRPYVKDPVELNRDIVVLVAQQMADALIEHAGRQPDGARHSLSPQPPCPAQCYLRTPCSPAPAAGE